jgi:arylsulfatase A-like enzyme
MLSLVLLALVQSPAAPPASDAHPNIVLAIADDLDMGHLGFLGDPLARTPSLDELAAEGTSFSVLYAQPVCRPALATLLSGRWPHQTGITRNQLGKELDPAGVLPARLRAQGYATFCGGKFWEGDHRAYGFDAPEVQDEAFLRDDETGATRAELFAWLAERADDGPWFVWWAPSLPHTPHEAPERFVAAFADADVPVPAHYTGDREAYVAAERAMYAMDAWLDAEFALLLAELDELGERDDTLIVFLADNGWSTALPSKTTPFEKGVRSPLVFSVPASQRDRAPRTVDARVDLVDVTATLLDYAGASDASAPGQSLRPWLAGGTGPSRALLCGASYRRLVKGGPEQQLYALYARDERWKYVLYLQSLGQEASSPGSRLALPWRARAGKELLFDLAADPFELDDRSGDEAQAERKAALRAGVLEWWRTSGGGELDVPEPR